VNLPYLRTISTPTIMDETGLYVVVVFLPL